ncbi:MAG: response regulator transcription factor [Clostridiaceae bacterium]|nr:response regulator transcription factor [Clostridiaceae bacterium]
MALVYIVEDDTNIREIEEFSLKNSGYQVEEFDCAKKFWNRINEKLPDIILMDVMLPDEDGLTAVSKIRKRSDTRRIPVIMVTAKSSEIDRVKGLDIGADDYLVKPFGVMELISRVKALLRRTKDLGSSKSFELGEIYLDDEKRRVYVGKQLVELTYKEYELLKYFLQNAGIVLQREDIMVRVWGTDYEGESRTLDMHIKTLRKKLGEAGKHIKTIRNVGYRME